MPKVIDFGIAKAIDQRLTERTLFTQHGTIIGTLEYMSPEQAEMIGHGRRHADRRLCAGRAALRAVDRHRRRWSEPRLREAGYAEILGGSARRSRPSPSTRLSGSSERAAVGRGAAEDRAGAADEAGAWRAGLDRDEGDGEGPHPALRDGQRFRPRHRALPGRRPGGGGPAVGVRTGCGSSRASTGRRWSRPGRSPRCWSTAAAVEHLAGRAGDCGRRACEPRLATSAGQRATTEARPRREARRRPSGLSSRRRPRRQRP